MDHNPNTTVEIIKALGGAISALAGLITAVVSGWALRKSMKEQQSKTPDQNGQVSASGEK